LPIYFEWERGEVPKSKPEEKLYGVRLPIEIARIVDKQVKPHGSYSSAPEFIRDCVRKQLRVDGLL
jgi:Arc/MetJ-type ribon-helix-helix transcriptional regulator